MVFGSAQPSAPASETQSAETAERELAAFGVALKGEPLSSKSLKPFRQVRFSLHTHLRFCLALMAATAIAGGGLLFATGLLVRHGHAAQPVMVNPATLVHTHAAPKEARLTPAMGGDPASNVSRRIDIAEGVEDGDARLYTYQHVVLDLKGQSRAQIDDTLRGAVSTQKSLPKRPEEELERGVPINVSLAKPASATGAKVHEIIVAPQSRERLGALLQAAGIAVEDSKRLEEALARTELVPGDNLELLVDKSRQHTNGEQHIALARFEHGDIGKAIYGRADDGVFRATGDERLFARLSRDAMLTAYSPQGAPDSSGSIASRLGQAGAPKAIVDEVGKLAAQNGVSLDGAGKPDLIDLLFRRSAETEPELVFVEFTTGDNSRRLYRHESENGTGYFNEDGSSMANISCPSPCRMAVSTMVSAGAFIPFCMCASTTMASTTTRQSARPSWRRVTVSWS